MAKVVQSHAPEQEIFMCLVHGIMASAERLEVFAGLGGQSILYIYIYIYIFFRLPSELDLPDFPN